MSDLLMAAQRLPRLVDNFDARDLPPGNTMWQIDFFHQPTRFCIVAVYRR